MNLLGISNQKIKNPTVHKSLKDSSSRKSTSNNKDGLFVTVGEYGTILYSKNGIKWNFVEPIVENNLWDIVYGNDIFVAVYKGLFLFQMMQLTGKIMINTYKYFLDIIFQNNTFFVVGIDGVLLKSNDGKNWKPINLEPKHGHTGLFLVMGNTLYRLPS